MKLSAIVNTHNEERNIARCLRSIAAYVDEIIVVDMHSNDKTRSIAKNYTQKVYLHDYTGYVEPARNFAVSKAQSDWIFVLDADEVIPESLGLELRRLIEDTQINFYRIPRKNIIFKNWIRHSGWWPDYQVRLFKKGEVDWQTNIHSVPITQGLGKDLTADEGKAITHYNYQSISQFIERLNRYTTQEAQELVESGNVFNWQQLISKPANEFFSRYFALEGYKDGLHGLVLSLLQALSVCIVYAKVWEKSGFIDEIKTHEILIKTSTGFEKVIQDLRHWYYSSMIKESSTLSQKIVWKLRNIFKI